MDFQRSHINHSMFICMSLLSLVSFINYVNLEKYRKLKKSFLVIEVYALFGLYNLRWMTIIQLSNGGSVVVSSQDMN